MESSSYTPSSSVVRATDRESGGGGVESHLGHDFFHFSVSSSPGMAQVLHNNVFFAIKKASIITLEKSEN